MSDSGRLTTHDDKTFGRDTRGLVLIILVIAYLGVLFWQTVIAGGML